MMEKKRKLPWIWIVVAVILIAAIIFVLFKANVFEKKTINQQKPCTANTTLSCSDGSVIITQQCDKGVLVNTGKRCPCTTNTTITCSKGDVIVTQECVNGNLIGTGKICPCTADIAAACYDGSVIITWNCINETLISTGKACPPRPTPIPIELNAIRLQTLFQKSSYFIQLPGNAAVLLSFFDGNGAMRTEKFFISGGGAIKNYGGEGYDLEFTMGDYRVPELESSSDFCAALTSIKNQQDLRIGLKNVFSIGKYAYLKSCVPFT
jgi:hypothetical protein